MREVSHRLEKVSAHARLRKRHWGYIVWLIAGAVIAVPELIAAGWSHKLPFTTISTMTGHLERHHNWVELIVVALIVLVVFSIARLRPPYRAQSEREAEAADGQPAEARRRTNDPDQFQRTPGGRLAARAPADDRHAADYDADLARALFTVCAVVSLIAVGVGTWAATRWWDDPRHFQPAYVLYGSLGLIWLVIPSFVALVFQRDVPFPTLFRTVGNLEDWLSGRKWPWTLGSKLAWIVAYVVFAGLAILLLHLTLYPYPDITHILNPTG